MQSSQVFHGKVEKKVLGLSIVQAAPCLVALSASQLLVLLVSLPHTYIARDDGCWWVLTEFALHHTRNTQPHPTKLEVTVVKHKHELRALSKVTYTKSDNTRLVLHFTAPGAAGKTVQRSLRLDTRDAFVAKLQAAMSML